MIGWRQSDFSCLFSAAADWEVRTYAARCRPGRLGEGPRMWRDAGRFPVGYLVGYCDVGGWCVVSRVLGGRGKGGGAVE